MNNHQTAFPQHLCIINLFCFCIGFPSKQLWQSCASIFFLVDLDSEIGKWTSTLGLFLKIGDEKYQMLLSCPSPKILTSFFLTSRRLEKQEMKKIVLKVLGDSRRYFAERISNLIFYLFYCPLVSLYIKLSLYNFNSFDN